MRLTFSSLRLRIIQLLNTGVNSLNGFARKPSVEKGDKRKMEPLLCLGHDNFTHNCRAGARPRLDHDQSQKGPHGAEADVHPIGNLLAAQALQHILQYFSLTLREIELLGDLGQWDQPGGPSFEDGYAGVSRIFCLRIQEEGAAKITPPSGSELGHKG